MFVVVALLAAFLAYETRWIHRRQQYLAEHPEALMNLLTEETTTAPGLLWLLGERGRVELSVQVPDFYQDKDYHRTHAGPEAELARELFPEATVVVRTRHTIWYTWKPGKPWTWGMRTKPPKPKPVLPKPTQPKVASDSP
jgi:hypothetical protein